MMTGKLAIAVAAGLLSGAAVRRHDEYDALLAAADEAWNNVRERRPLSSITDRQHFDSGKPMSKRAKRRLRGKGKSK